MTDKEKLIKIKSLADKMSDTAFNMTTNASLLRKAIDEYHQFIINEYHKEEQAIKELQEEPVSEKWIEELRTKLDSMSKEDFKKVFDKYAIDFNEEPASEDLEKASYRFACKCHPLKTECSTSIPNREVIEAFKACAKWQREQFEKDYTNLCNGIATAKGLAVTMAYNKGVADTKEQMMANTADATIGLPYENKDGGYTHLVDVSRPLPVGNNKIAIIFKED